jgi:hypothetical protein
VSCRLLCQGVALETATLMARLAVTCCSVLLWDVVQHLTTSMLHAVTAGLQPWVVSMAAFSAVCQAVESLNVNVIYLLVQVGVELFGATSTEACQTPILGSVGPLNVACWRLKVGLAV